MALPAVIEPCLPSPGERPPTGPDWVHEIKHDGYRLMARRDALSVGIRLLTRNHQQGAYNGREAEWARLEHDIIRAGAEGRIRGAVDLHGKGAHPVRTTAWSTTASS